ncbi:MAG: hypothetical protein AMXMBFR74_27490 [Parvibaculum sp.]
MPKRPWEPAPPHATLIQISNAPGWFRVYCEKIGCGHRSAVPIAPLYHPGGPETPGDVLRRSLKCTKCGTKGASIKRPGYLDNSGLPEPFSVDELSKE